MKMPRNVYMLWFGLILCTVALASCGGGGGEEAAAVAVYQALLQAHGMDLWKTNLEAYIPSR